MPTPDTTQPLSRPPRRTRPGLPTVPCPACHSRLWAAEPVEDGAYELKCEICCRVWADWAPGDPDWAIRRTRVATPDDYIRVQVVREQHRAVTETEAERKARRSAASAAASAPAPVAASPLLAGPPAVGAPSPLPAGSTERAAA